MASPGNNATPPGPAIAPGASDLDTRRAAERAAIRGMHPVIRRVLPAFDAPFCQAGLAGYSDAAMRLIARRHGCPYCITEALLDRTLLAGGRGFAKADLGELHENIPGGADDHPLACQIMGSDPLEMAAAALKVAEQASRPTKAYRLLAYPDGRLPSTPVRNPGGEQIAPACDEDELDESCELAIDAANPLDPSDDDALSRGGLTFEVVDVNLACPVKKIDRKARGGHWLAEPSGAIRLLEAVREAVPGHIPCAVKLRRAYDDTPEMAENFERIFSAAYEIGYAWTTVHARTVEQRYLGPSRWTFLRDLARRHPQRPIIGSGDVWDVHDVFRMIEYTGVAAVSIARGCIGNPWIFRQAREMLAGRAPSRPSIAEQRRVLDDHFGLSLRVHHRARRGEEVTGRTMRKFGIRFATHHPLSDIVRERMTRVSCLEDWRAVLAEFYPMEDEAPSLVALQRGRES